MADLPEISRELALVLQMYAHWLAERLDEYATVPQPLTIPGFDTPFDGSTDLARERAAELRAFRDSTYIRNYLRRN